MDTINIIFQRMRDNGDAAALYWKGKKYSYAEFMKLVDEWSERLPSFNIHEGTVCGILSDYSPQTCALFFALIKANALLVPFTKSIRAEIPEFKQIAGVQRMFTFDEQDKWTFESYEDVPQNDLVIQFLERKSPGLIVFSSGSTGKPKGILHDIERVMRKFIDLRPGWNTVLFLMMDHFGGFNTLLSSFAYNGLGVCVGDRSAQAVCEAIEKAGATLLPVTPTFLNLLLASGSYHAYDLSSIKLITYGTEVMSETTLQQIRDVFPNAKVKQTYGLSEVGVLRSKSESDDSVWVKVGGKGFDVKIVDNTLWVKSEANMVGYLNAPSPFDEEGWLNTGDQVEIQGEYIRFLGRKSEIINVGGQKVFPVEVETVLLEDDNVREAAVYGVKHPIMGSVVHARVSLKEPEEATQLTNRLRKLCLNRLTKYKVPMRFHIVDESEQRGERFKKLRRGFDE